MHIRILLNAIGSTSRIKPLRFLCRSHRRTVNVKIDFLEPHRVHELFNTKLKCYIFNPE